MNLISDDTVALRALEPADIETLYGWENDPALWTVSGTQAPYSRHLLAAYLSSYTGDIYASRQLRLMITLCAGAAPIGTVDFIDFDPLNNRAELGLLIAPGCQGHGYGRRALRLIKQYARDHIGLRQLYVVIADANAPCITIFKQEGFDVSGRLKSWIKQGRTYHDASLMQIVF